MELDFYFNEWAFLARTDPELFERRRREFVDAFVNSSGEHKPRLESLQREIDHQRELAATPERAVVVISKLMCESLSDLGEKMTTLLDDLKELEENAQKTSPDFVQEVRREMAA